MGIVIYRILLRKVIIMAVLLSLKKLDNEVSDDNTEDVIEPDKYSLGSVKTYFRNLMRTNSYVVGKSGRRKSPLPDIVKEFFTMKSAEETDAGAEGETFQTPTDEQENLLDEHDDDDDYYSKSANSFTNLRLRLIDDSLEEAEERLDNLVASSEEKSSIGGNSCTSFSFSFDEDSSITESCFGRLHLEESENCESEKEFDMMLSEDEVAEADSDNDIVVDHLGENDALDHYGGKSTV